jgi:uncharacterized protein (TIGR02271 family)
MPDHYGHETQADARGDRSRGTEAARLARLGDLDDYDVADGEPDVRGWNVRTSDGRHGGRVAELIADLSAMEVRYLDVELDKEALRLGQTRHVLVPISIAALDEKAKAVDLGVSATELIATPRYDPRSFLAADEDVLRRWYAGRLTRSEEELAVGTRRRMAGKVEVRKRVETEHVEQSVPVTREEVTVERRPARGMAAKPEIGEDEIVVPVTEEEVVAAKRAVPKEEVVIKKRPVRDEKTVSADVKKERIDVERQ